MKLDLNETLKELERAERMKLKHGYRSESTNYAFKRHSLMLLSEIAQKMSKKKRKLSAWQVFLTEYLRKGKSIKDASVDWNKGVR